ncbi:tetratricopeptide repeat protein [Thiocapsa rosea]|uniref:Tetratricopeptide repeat protein n=1 Tax=Thiocapsa rosea TaxID=69360 RepID=A0A495VA79_9GAMM|nr:hypothetical protein [Thiocapsa rosea]RKT45277.1 hypothetical protein BDD21_2713 [Thiocapsa rosea]
MSRALALVVLTVVSLLWATAALQGWWVGRLAGGSTHGTLPGDALVDPAMLPIPPRLPWSGGDAAREWARRLLPLSGDASEPRKLLEVSLRERPLYAPTWLDLGELLASSGDREGAARSIRVARALWPERATLQQRAAWMQVALGPPDAALAALMDYWAVAPQDGLRTLGLARRFEPAPEALVDAAAQVWSSGPHDALVYQRGLLDVARRARDPALAQALWARLDDESRALEDLLFPYLQILAAQGRHAQADAVWEDALGEPPGLVNGRFEEPLVPLGPDFRPGWATPGWRYNASGDGFRIGVEGPQGDAEYSSLRIDFLGTANVDLAQPSQIMRVRPGTSYRLHGYWAGEGITTRSGVFVELYTVETNPVVRVRTPSRWGSWAREPFELDIQIPEDGLLVAVRVRRTATTALDRLLSGTLRLDTLEFQPTQP